MTMLYKYLDVAGGLAMLEHHNLQFTNASKFNDPFDCHPALFDYSHAPVHKNNWQPDVASSLREDVSCILSSYVRRPNQRHRRKAQRTPVSHDSQEFLVRAKAVRDPYSWSS